MGTAFLHLPFIYNWLRVPIIMLKSLSNFFKFFYKIIKPQTETLKLSTSSFRLEKMEESWMVHEMDGHIFVIQVARFLLTSERARAPFGW